MAFNLRDTIDGINEKAWERAMQGADRDILRRVRLSPYPKGSGPTFTLITWATNRTDWRGQTKIGYELKQHENGRTVVLFSAQDFAGSPMHSDDSDDTIAALMGFLTLMPGDTDREYFANYTPEQLEYCANHAETLAIECMHRFGGDNF